MSTNARSLLKVAASLSERDPLLAYELEENVRHMMAVINPGATSFHHTVQESQEVLTKIKDQLVHVIKSHKLIDDKTARQFVEMMGSEAKGEAEILSHLLEEAKAYNLHTSATRLAFFGKLKNFFKKPEPEYELVDLPYPKISIETQYNKKYFKLVEDVKNDFMKLMKSPTKKLLDALKGAVDTALLMGENILSGRYKTPGSDYSPYELDEEDLEQIEDPALSKQRDEAEIRKILQKIQFKKYETPQEYNGMLRDLYWLLDKTFGKADVDTIMKTSAQITRFASKNPRLRSDILKVARLALG